MMEQFVFNTLTPPPNLLAPSGAQWGHAGICHEQFLSLI